MCITIKFQLLERERGEGERREGRKERGRDGGEGRRKKGRKEEKDGGRERMTLTVL